MLTDEQKAKRRNGIGASDSPIIMGYSNYKTPYQLYLEKTGQISNEDEITEVQYWGNMIEPLIVQRFAEENDVTVSLPDTVYHPKYPFIFANLDGWIESENAVLETKCANSFQRYAWNMAETDGIPLNYLIQIAKQCAITDASRGYCAVLIGGMEYKQFIYERDKALEDMIIKSDIDFWECVQNKTPPDAINTSDCRLKYPTPSPEKMVTSTFKTQQYLNDLSQAKSDAKKLAEQEESYKTLLMSYMGDAEYLVAPDGEILVTWKANKKGTRVFNIK